MSDELAKLENAISALCELKDKKPSVAFLLMYRKALLNSLTLEEAISAVEMAFSRKTYGFPSPGDLIEWIRGSEGDRSLTAWTEVMEAFGRVGADTSVLFADPKITRTIELLGGWIKLCGMEGDECDWARREFAKIYKSLPGNLPQKTLYGFHELENRAKGYLPASEGSSRFHCIPPPTIIGIERPPLKVISGGKEE